MDKFMVNFAENNLRTRMAKVYNLYLRELVNGDLVPLSVDNYLIYKSLTVREYKLRGTFWASTGIFYDDTLIALISENGTIYSFVNMFSYCPEIACMITQHLVDLIKALDLQSQLHFIYPKTNK